MNSKHIVKSISTSSPTMWHNATKLGVYQVLVIILTSISGINWIYRITVVGGVGLAKARYLPLSQKINIHVAEFNQIGRN